MMRWWRKRRIAAFARQRAEDARAVMDLLRRSAAEEDRVCALFGPDCVRVERHWDRRHRMYVLTVTYRDGRTETVRANSFAT
jgi:hypothetical protein